MGIANGWRPVLSIRLATPPTSDRAGSSVESAPAGGFDAREERDLRGELGDMPQVRAAAAPVAWAPRAPKAQSSSSKAIEAQ